MTRCLRTSPHFKLDTESDTPPLGDNKTTQGVVTLTGNTSPGATVTLGDSLFILKETVADADGRFEFHDVSLPLGEIDFTTTATDLAGNQSSSTVTVTRLSNDTSSPTISIIAPPHDSDVVEQSTFDLSVTASDDVAVTTVDFFLDDLQIGSDDTAPFSVTITVPPLDDLGETRR